MMYKECFPESGWKIALGLKDILLKHNAILAGGTALALQLGHRKSVDLDFFTASDFRVETALSEIKRSGRAFTVMSEGEGTLIVNIEGTKLSLLKYEYPFLEKPVAYRGIPVAGILDIASMKVIAVNQRGTKRDFADLYFILQDMPFRKLASHMVRRYGKERINPVHIGKSLVCFPDAESDPDPEYMEGKSIDWAKVKKFFRNYAKQFVLDLDRAVADIG